MIINFVNNIPLFSVNFQQEALELTAQDINMVAIKQSYLEYIASSEKLDIAIKQTPLEIIKITNV